MSEDKALVQLQFEDYRNRRILDEDTGEWWYAVADVIEALTDSQKPRDYWYRMKKRVAENEGVELSTICRQFKLKAPNNRFYDTDCADTEGMLRIIQSIPSPKAEPFKRWLAEVGTERLEELEAETGRPAASSTNYLERPQVEQAQLRQPKKTTMKQRLERVRCFSPVWLLQPCRGS